MKSSPHYSKEDFLRAISFAHEKHYNQTRKQSGVPYIIHPMRVAFRLMELGYDYKVGIAALLHDTLEDTNTSQDEISNLFGTEILEMVLSLTEEKIDQDQKISWKQRKQSTIDKASILSPGCLAILCSDKLDNLLCSVSQYRIHGSQILFQAMNAGLEDQRWYYRGLLRTFLNRNHEFNSKVLLEDFKTAYEIVFLSDEVPSQVF